MYVLNETFWDDLMNKVEGYEAFYQNYKGFLFEMEADEVATEPIRSDLNEIRMKSFGREDYTLSDHARRKATPLEIVKHRLNG